MHPILFQDTKITPSKIVCIGRNYVEHIQELGNEMPDEMVVFNKPASAVTDVLLSQQGEAIHYEAELCFLVENGQFAGVGLGLDLTKRGLQSKLKAKGLPWERAKAFDGSAVFSRFVPLNNDIEQLRFTLHINDELIQAGDPALMIYAPATILTEVANFMSLTDGDIIMTGTPKGVGQVTQGAIYTARLFANDTLLIEHSWQGI